MPNRRLIASLLTLSLASTPTAVLAQDPGSTETEPQDAEQPDARSEWTKSFPGDAAASYFPTSSKVRTVVVAAGEHAEVDMATDVLEEALRNTGKFKLVMNDDMLADNSKLDDEQIFAKAKHLPVRYMAIVRVFDAGAGQPPTAVVTIYDKVSSEAVAAMSATRGVPVEASAEVASSPGSGVSKKAAEAVAETTEEQVEQAEADDPSLSDRELARAKQEYLENYIWFEDVTAVNQYGSVVGQWSNVYRGKYKKPLAVDEFYEEIGRSDLADDYNKKRALKYGLFGVGVAVAIGGAAYGMTAKDPWLDIDYVDCDAKYDWYEQEAQYNACQDRVEAAIEKDQEIYDTRQRNGWILFGAGSLVYLGSLLINPHPVELSEAKRLADKHNQRLKRRLGLADALADEQASNYSWSIDATGNADGGGLRLRVEF
ncbi:hypothetical protein FIV42_13565 [Persicimonas caeni]|uniref:DUF5683 domain-containing protein n=1 Tax=Persicimonas caeni TaxID=2292766 RepID=A0A4Y6PTW2_PERCE|nr:hypothetical protein [Persicimonas caeni]QDG51738.1 hypothetical protein FIV42_13565 [Persicimonas caeni]QED32959.1 hypothetical protein FRD00_13560 [Persicimonas caeni]